jgi:hypothetical protein
MGESEQCKGMKSIRGQEEIGRGIKLEKKPILVEFKDDFHTSLNIIFSMLPFERSP